MPTKRRELPHYIQIESGEWVVVRERGRHARFRNPDRTAIWKVRVDGGLITSGERADYVVAHPGAVDVVVELKDSDVSKAISQIRATLPIWRTCEWAGTRCGALVVRGKGIHPRLLTHMERWQREFRKRGMRLLIEAGNRDYEFRDFT